MCTPQAQLTCMRVVDGADEPVGEDHCPPGCCSVEVTIGTVFNVYRCKKCGCEEWL